MPERDLLYLGVSGDGDSASIGLGQFAHAMRRNVNMVYIVENNGVYGLTKGQFSATADKGSKSKRGVVNNDSPIDLVTLAGFKPAGVLCELTNDDGTMARAPECIKFAKEHNMALVTIEDLVAYRREHERKAS